MRKSQYLLLNLSNYEHPFAFFLGGDIPPSTGGVFSSRDINSPAVKNRTIQPPQPAPRSTVDSQTKRAGDQSALPVVRKKDREYLGMFEYLKEDEHALVSRLISGKLTLSTIIISGFLNKMQFCIYSFVFCRSQTSNSSLTFTWITCLHFNDVHSPY